MPAGSMAKRWNEVQAETGGTLGEDAMMEGATDGDADGGQDGQEQ